MEGIDWLVKGGHYQIRTRRAIYDRARVNRIKKGKVILAYGAGFAKSDSISISTIIGARRYKS